MNVNRFVRICSLYVCLLVCFVVMSSLSFTMSELVRVCGM